MRKEIQDLEQIARQLEPGPDSREALTNLVVGHAEQFIRRMDADQIKSFEHQDNSTELDQYPIAESGKPISTLLDILERTVDTPGINPASGGHLGYIPGGGLYPAALGDYLADVTNRYAGIYFANPGAVRMENQMVRWMNDLIGYGPHALGTLTSGGSIANLIGITTARDTLKIRSADVPQTVIYLTSQTHHCIDKAIRIAGLAESQVRRIPLDQRYRMDPQALEDQIRSDREKGLRPAILVASVGSTDTGAVDPIKDLALIAESAGLWLHVDAAYGGFFQLVPELAHFFAGVEQSHSYILDPHKGLFLPYGTGAALIRDGEQLHASFWYQANYMQDATQPDEVSPAELSPELTRHFRGLRMWLPLQLFGLAPIRAGLKEKWMLARYFHQAVYALGFDTGPEPDLSVVIYRYTHGLEAPNAFNKSLLHLLHTDGRVFVSSTLINGEYWLRFAALSFRTHLHHTDLLLEMLQTHLHQLLRH